MAIDVPMECNPHARKSILPAVHYFYMDARDWALTLCPCPCHSIRWINYIVLAN